MLNQVVLVGRIQKIINLENNEQLQIIVTVPRDSKNENGEYDLDTLTCTIYNSITNVSTQSYEIGDVVGIKGRLQSTSKNEMYLVANKVTILKSIDEM